MKIKYHILFLILSIITIISYLVLIKFINQNISGIIHVFLLLLSCVFLLPYSIHRIRSMQNPTPVDWRILYTNIFFIIIFLACFVIVGSK